jgi:PEP-CTERM motif
MLRRFTSPLLAIAMAGLLILGLSERAHADLSVSLNNGVPQTLSGNGHLAFDLTSGTVNASGTANGETFLNTPASMDLSAFTITSSGPGTETLIFSMNNINSPVGLGTISELITGSFSFGSNTVSYTTYGSNSNTLYSSLPLTPAPDAHTGTVGLGGSSTGSFTATAPYSLTEVLTINFTSAGSVNLSSDSRASFAVPEPSSMAMAGLGALGFIAYGLRRRKAQGA